MALTQITTDGIKDGTITGTDLTTNVDLVDNQKLRLGTGNDLQIYHDGTNSYIDNKTNRLYIRNNTAGNTGHAIILQAISGQSSINLMPYGRAELMFNGNKKFETTSAGATVTGSFTATDEIILADGKMIRLGTDGDCLIEHTGSVLEIDNNTGGINMDSTDTIQLRVGGNETAAKFIPNGAVELYHDNSKKFETTSSGIFVTGNILQSGYLKVNDNQTIYVGIGNDLQIYHDGLNSYIRENGTGSLYIDSNGNGVVLRGIQGEDSIVCNANGDVELYHDNIKRFETTSSGISVAGNGVFTGNVQINDGNFLNVGNSGDLQIFHNGSNSYIQDNGTGALLIGSNGGGVFIRGQHGEESIIANSNGSVELYYDNSKKLETTTNGIQMTGDIRFNNSTWTGETTNGKIQTHGSNMYLQNAGGSWQFRKTNGTAAANIASNGTYTASDLTFKKDVATISNSVDTIKKLTGRSFTWKEDNTKSFGVIAQEVETVLPELVTNTEEPEGSEVEPSKMVNYPAFAGHFIEAIKELATKVEALETEVAALKAG